MVHKYRIVIIVGLIVILLFYVAPKIIFLMIPPKNLDECNEFLDQILSRKSKKFIQSTSENECIERFDLVLKRLILKNWILGKTKKPLKQFFDDVSVRNSDYIVNIIFKNYWYHLNKKPKNIVALITQAQENELNDTKRYLEQKKKEERYLKMVDKHRLTISLVSTNPDRVRFPGHKYSDLQAANDFIKYKSGYIINSIASWPEIEGKAEVQSEFYYYNVDNLHFYKIKVEGVEFVESMVTKDDELYVSGLTKKRHRVVRKYSNSGMEEISLTIQSESTDNLGQNSWIKLGFYQNKLVALQQNGVYQYSNGSWSLLKRIKIDYPAILPTANIKVVGETLYFYQEILFSWDCQLYLIDLNQNTVAKRLWDKMGIDINYLMNVNDYFIKDSMMWVNANILQKDALITYEKYKISYWIYDNKIRTGSGEQNISGGVVIEADNKTMLIGKTGLYELREEQTIKPIVLFEDIGDSPRCAVYLGDDSFLIGGRYGGLYKLAKQSGKYKVFTCDDYSDDDLLIYQIK